LYKIDDITRGKSKFDAHEGKQKSRWNWCKYVYYWL